LTSPIYLSANSIMIFYAVAKGFSPGIYTTWTACTQAVNGFPGAKYKKFDTRLEAEDFINLQQSQLTYIEKTITSDYYVYTDGSCSKNGSKSAQAGIGVYFGPDDPRNLSQRVIGKQTNNTAEITAIIHAYKIVEPDIKKHKTVTICSDSQYAIGCATKYGKKQSEDNWSKDIPNKELVKQVYDLYKDQPNIKFMYVPAHTGKSDAHSVGNDGADKLANLAIGLEQCPYTKIYLTVPFSRKDEAKALGAKWDPAKKKWYIMDSSDNKNTLVEMFS
jgi:ribonuclease HI